MRLICPECNALYDIPDEMIPPAGREVECSACGHVWMQAQAAQAAPPPVPRPAPEPERQPPRSHTMRGLSEDLRAAARPARDVPLDLGAAPVLQRPLPDDVLSILREETARELGVRRGDRQAAPAMPEPAEPAPPEPEPEPEIVMPAPPRPETCAPPVAEASAPEAPAARPVPDPVPVAEPERAAAPAPKAVSAPESRPGPATPSRLVDDPVPAPPAVPVADDPVPSESYSDWPATTVTAADFGPMAESLVPAAPFRRKPDPAPAAAPEPGWHPATRNPRSAPPAPPPRRLPDAERIAATLLTEMPPPAEVPPAPPPPAPASGYRAGMGRALSVSAALLVAYVAAAGWVGSGQAPGPVVSVVAGVDAARAGLQDAAYALFGQETE